MHPHHRRSNAGVAVALMLAATVTGACGGSQPGASPSPASTSPAPTGPAPESVGPTTAPAPTTTPTQVSRPVTVAVAGDVHFEGVLRSRLDDPATALAPAASPLAEADAAIVNLETSVGTGGRPEPGKRYTFQAPPSAFTALAAAGIDVATMANNHALDFGREPLPGMFDAIDAASTADPPLAVVGIGRDAAAAFRPAIIDVDGTTVATVGATVADDDPTADPTGLWAATDESPGTADAINPTRLLRAVDQADRSADVVVVYMHWGIQGEQCPTDSQQALAAALVGAGADVVVGSHTHRLQGAGRLGEGYVAYGLGNYAWYSQASDATSITGVLTLTIEPAPNRAGSHATVVSADWAPARIGPDGLPAPLTGAERTRFDADLAALRACADLEP